MTSARCALACASSASSSATRSLSADGSLLLLVVSSPFCSASASPFRGGVLLPPDWFPPQPPLPARTQSLHRKLIHQLAGAPALQSGAYLVGVGADRVWRRSCSCPALSDSRNRATPSSSTLGTTSWACSSSTGSASATASPRLCLLQQLRCSFAPSPNATTCWGSMRSPRTSADACPSPWRRPAGATSRKKGSDLAMNTRRPKISRSSICSASSSSGPPTTHDLGGGLGQPALEVAHARHAKLEAHPVGDLERWLTEPTTKIVVVGEPELLDALQIELREIFGRRVFIAKSLPFFLEVAQPDVSKGSALHLGVRPLAASIPSTLSHSATAPTTSSCCRRQAWAGRRRRRPGAAGARPGGRAQRRG